MADDDDLNLDDAGSDGAGIADSGKKAGGMLPSLLRWVAIGLVVIILIIVVCVCTFKILGGSDTQGGVTFVENPEEYTVVQEDLDWYTSLETQKVRTVGEDAVQVIANVRLGYKKEDKVASAEISGKIVLIEDYLRRYFRGRTAEELLPENEDAIRIEIRNAINDTILQRSKIKDVRFKQFEVIPQ